MTEPQTIRVPNDRNQLGSDEYLEMFVITRPTRDYPDKYTVRRHVCKLDLVEVDEDPLGHGQTLDEARRLVPLGKTRLACDPIDEPVISEVWV